MSATFPDLQNTTAPDIYQELKKLQDISILTKPKMDIYQGLLADGDISGANTYLSENADLQECIFMASDFNTLIDTLAAMQRYVVLGKRQIVVSASEPTGDTNQITGDLWFKSNANYFTMFVKNLDGTYSELYNISDDSVVTVNASLTSGNIGSGSLSGIFAKIKKQFIDCLISNSMTIGTRKTGSVIGENSTSTGYDNTASGECSVASGNNSTASGNNSTANGYGTIASKSTQTAIGHFNAVNDVALFMVGNGESDTERTNAFEVLEDGTAKVYGDVKCKALNGTTDISLRTIDTAITRSGLKDGNVIFSDVQGTGIVSGITSSMIPLLNCLTKTITITSLDVVNVQAYTQYNSYIEVRKKADGFYLVISNATVRAIFANKGCTVTFTVT